MPLDHYVTLGRTGLRVSPFCLGTMTFGQEPRGSGDWGSSVAESQRILDRYIDAGGNFIDTANIYARGHSEKILGDHLGRDRRKRERLVLGTKFFGSMFSGDPNAGGASRKSILAQLDESLRRLQTDYVDVYFMHNWDRHVPVEETMRGLDDLVTAGKIRYIGFSNTPAWKVAHAETLARAANRASVAAIQIEYSLLERSVEGDLCPMARDFGISIMPWSPLKYGVLSGKYRRNDAHAPNRAFALPILADQKTFDVVEVADAIARELGTTTATVALAWVQARPGVTSTVIGVKSVDQLDDNLRALDLRLSEAHLQKLDDASRPKLAFPADLLDHVGRIAYAGTTIHGTSYPPIPSFAPPTDAERH